MLAVDGEQRRVDNVDGDRLVAEGHAPFVVSKSDAYAKLPAHLSRPQVRLVVLLTITRHVRSPRFPVPIAHPTFKDRIGSPSGFDLHFL